ncbi:MAG: TonB-dependent receptor plug domain-containing protein, partial [Pseudomonadota bacterium]
MHVISRALRTHCVVAVLALTATLVTSVHADDIDEITVTATRIERPLSRLPFSADVVTRDNIASAQPLLGLDESLQQVPGLQMQNRFNFAQDLRISMRGFGARAAFGIRGIRIIVDGIPETLPDGQSGVDGIDLGSAQRIEVLRGGASAIYGNAGGGVILVDSRTGSDVFTSEVALAAGADGYQRVEANAAGPVGDWRYFAALSNLTIDGFRDHSEAENRQATLRLSYGAGEANDWLLSLHHTDQPIANDPGG